ncbi:MAG: hypothetical protein EOP06_07005 [Proteobacteria bacterium]|nr:MAG: hypothetical protein EOP06_07005 [Pseudomonadota bacterium]
MKISATILAFATVLLSLNASASTTQLIAVNACTPHADSDVYGIKYVPQASGEVTAVLTVIHSTGLASPAGSEDAPSFSEIDTGPIDGLVRRGNEIVNIESGVVCGKLKKPLLAKSKFAGTKACKASMTTEWKKVGSTRECISSTYLTIK